MLIEKKMASKEKPSQQVRVVLSKCCTEALEEIKDKLESARILKGVLLGTPFMFIFGNPIEGAFSIGTFDWETFGKALNSVDAIAKTSCRQVCGFHLLKHQKDKALRYFWRNMYDSFK